MMMQIHEGQCGLCSHFGEHHGDDQQLVQIRMKQQAPDDLIDECGHPRTGRAGVAAEAPGANCANPGFGQPSAHQRSHPGGQHRPVPGGLVPAIRGGAGRATSLTN